MKFEGWNQARQYAISESRKSTGTYYLILSHLGGVHYLVKKSIELLNPSESVLNKYEKGEIVK